MKVYCKACSVAIEFSERLTCPHCNTTHDYEKTDIRYTVKKTWTFSHKIFNRCKHVNKKNIVATFLIIISSTIVSTLDIYPKWQPMFLAIIITSTLYMLTKTTIVNYESSDPNIEKNIVF